VGLSPYSDPRAIELDQSDFSSGSLRRVSFTRPGKLFTAHVSLFQRVAGVLREETLASIRDTVIDILRQPKDQVVSI
jgi:mRNA interferase MazF